MSAVLAFSNQKGGVGKTTSAVNIAAALGMEGYSVLLVDADPQGNATSGVGVSKRRLTGTLYTALSGEGGAETAVVETGFENLSLLPSQIDLAACEVELASLDNREGRMRTLLDPLREKYDFILIDCPPSLGLLTINALAASDGVIIPMQCEYFALEGLSQLSETISRVRSVYRPSLSITGILITMYNGRLNLSLQVLAEIKKYYGKLLLKTPIPRNVRLSEAPSYGKPIGYYDRYSPGGIAYRLAAQEIAARAGK